MNTTTEPLQTRSDTAISWHSHRADVAPETKVLSPRDVLFDTKMSRAEKRALLASWASDARAVENAPGLRWLDGGEIASLDEIVETLEALDSTASEADVTQRPIAKLLPFAGPADRRPAKRHKKIIWPRRRDDDDDPPPAPAAAVIPRPRSPALFLYGGQPELLPAA